MKKWNLARFFFTQMSGMVLFGVVGFGGLTWLELSPQNFILAIGEAILILILAASVTHLWGRILVFFGILSKEEVKGYPFSAPWQNRKNRSGSSNDI